MKNVYISFTDSDRPNTTTTERKAMSRKIKKGTKALTQYKY